MAEVLDLSVKTIESHRANLMGKLDAHSATDILKIFGNSEVRWPASLLNCPGKAPFVDAE